MLYCPIMPSFRPIHTCFHTSRLSSSADFSMYIPFPASFIKRGSRPMLPIRRLPENDYWLSAFLATGRFICNREIRASHTSPACRWSAWVLRPSLHSRQSAPVRACPPRRPCLHRRRSWHSALSPLQGSRCAR